jgi:hypothetical protein
MLFSLRRNTGARIRDRGWSNKVADNVLGNGTFNPYASIRAADAA